MPHPGAILPRWPRKAEVIPAPRWWTRSRSRIGGLRANETSELPTGVLANNPWHPAPDRCAR